MELGEWAGAAAAASLCGMPLQPWALSQSRELWPKKGQIHLELQTALSLRGFSYCPRPGPGHTCSVLSLVGQQGGEAVGVRVAEGYSSLSGGGEREGARHPKPKPHVQNADPISKMKTIGLVLIWGVGDWMVYLSGYTELY